MPYKDNLEAAHAENQVLRDEVEKLKKPKEEKPPFFKRYKSAISGIAWLLGIIVVLSVVSASLYNCFNDQACYKQACIEACKGKDVITAGVYHKWDNHISCECITRNNAGHKINVKYPKCKW